MTLDTSKRAAEIVDSFHDGENAGEVIVCLQQALGSVITLAAHDKKDALATLDGVFKDLKQEIKKDFHANRKLHEEQFGDTQ